MCFFVASSRVVGGGLHVSGFLQGLQQSCSTSGPFLAGQRSGRSHLPDEIFDRP